MKGLARIIKSSGGRAACRYSGRARYSALCWPTLGSQPLRSSGVAIRSLSTSPWARANGSVDNDLSHTLSEEIKYEAAQAAEEGEPEFIQAFSNKTGFKVKTEAGKNVVLLTKQFGNESITVSFDVQEILNVDDPIADISVYRENDQGDTTKEAEKRADDAPEDFPIHFTATFSKPDAPVFYMELESSEGEIGVDHMRFMPDEATATGTDMASEWVRGQAYCGPIFGQLSDDLKENIDAFLSERNIDTALTLFMQDYIEFKEQSEYLTWLQKFKGFIDA
ncbi:Mitochondrial acidic protein mam33 [Coemansia sp. RSA 988]|nr:Mitochondrial acidic protein mam33 [Coemansia sp. RSA 988]